jgi:hypothetical protein
MVYKVARAIRNPAQYKSRAAVRLRILLVKPFKRYIVPHEGVPILDLGHGRFHLLSIVGRTMYTLTRATTAIEMVRC